MSLKETKIWQVEPQVNAELLEKFPDLKPLILQLLFNRGLTEKKDIDLFLTPDYKNNSYDPFLFSQMIEATELIISHIKAQNKITVYGDYDADGVTSSALMYEVLTTFKATADIYIPDRVTEGYSLNMAAIKQLADNGTKLIITVDGGIRNKAEVEYAREVGVDVIITDHHMPPEKKDMPVCIIINPMLEGEKYPFRFLAGVGVAFKLAQGLIRKSKLSDENKQRLEARLLDLVAIGTIADCVSLLGENRLLTQRGLDVVNELKRVGLQELFKVAKLNSGKKIDSWNIGFQIAPRLNAAGRMDHANTAFELLITKDRKEAEDIANKLNSSNEERQRATNEIMSEVEKQINIGSNDKVVIGLYNPDSGMPVWNEGVVGLVAGKLSEKYYRPAMVATITEAGYKGSGRSIKEFNLIESISGFNDVFAKFGGHASACGFTFPEENLEIFKKKMIQITEEKLKGIDLRPKLKIEAAINLAEVDENLIQQLEKFGPFGQDNDRPRFVSFKIKIADIMNMGADGQHIKMKLRAENSSLINAIGFGQSVAWRDLKIGDTIDIVYYIELNEFNGRSEAQLKIIDIKLSEEG